MAALTAEVRPKSSPVIMTRRVLGSIISVTVSPQPVPALHDGTQGQKILGMYQAPQVPAPVSRPSLTPGIPQSNGEILLDAGIPVTIDKTGVAVIPCLRGREAKSSTGPSTS